MSIITFLTQPISKANLVLGFCRRDNAVVCIHKGFYSLSRMSMFRGTKIACPAKWMVEC